MSAIAGVGGSPRRAPASVIGATFAASVIVLTGLLAGTGWLFVFRGLRWLKLGPRISDSLPLLQLAGFDGQPLLRVIVAWLLAGALVGVALVRWAPARRLAVVGLLALVLLLLASQASYALARNLRFTDILFTRAPGAGPVLEALALAAGSCLPGATTRRHHRGARRWSLVSAWTRFDDRGLGGGQHRDGAQDDGDRQQMDDHRPRTSA